MERLWSQWQRNNPDIAEVVDGVQFYPPAVPDQFGLYNHHQIPLLSSDLLVGFNVEVDQALTYRSRSFCHNYAPYSKSMDAVHIADFMDVDEQMRRRSYTSFNKTLRNQIHWKTKLPAKIVRAIMMQEQSVYTLKVNTKQNKAFKNTKVETSGVGNLVNGSGISRNETFSSTQKKLNLLALNAARDYFGKDLKDCNNIESSLAKKIGLAIWTWSWSRDS